MSESNTVSVLENLLQTVDNGRRGFADAADKLDGDGRADLAAEMRELSQQRLQMSNELRALAAAEGEPMEDTSGTFPGAMHRSWMALRDALTGDDPHAVLAAAEQGEDHAVSEYSKALDEDMPASIRTVVERQAGEVSSAHDRVRALRGAT